MPIACTTLKVIYGSNPDGNSNKYVYCIILNGLCNILMFLGEKIVKSFKEITTFKTVIIYFLQLPMNI